jgi:hypothetical protein
VTTGQIYRGAIPFVVIQLLMVGLVIAFPQMVMVYKDPAPVADPAKTEIIIPPAEQAPAVDLMEDLKKSAPKDTPKENKKKTPEELDAEAIEKALRGGK